MAAVHDLARVHRALARLDELVMRHPHLTEGPAQERLKRHLEKERRPMARDTKGKFLMVRSDEAFLRQIDEELVPLVEERCPGMKITRSDAVRYAIAKALAAMKAENP